MIGILIALFLFASAIVIVYRAFDEYDRTPVMALTALFSICILGIFTPTFLIPITGGFPIQGGGESQGYVTEVYQEGLVWVTCNLVMKQGDSGSITAWAGCITDDELKNKAASMIGKKVRVHFKKWLVAPFWVGKYGDEITSIEEIE
jgi:hypothetical protein